MTAFVARLQELGWTEGRNLRVDYRWGGGADARIAALAKELVDLQPDALFAANNSCAVALRQYTLAIPIVFTHVGDPVAAGLVTNLARPEGNITGFPSFDFTFSSKWIEALKDCVPGLRRAAVLFDPGSPPWPQYVRAIEAAARSLRVQLIPLPVQSDVEIERAFEAYATEPNGALVVAPTTSTLARREKIIALAERYRLPTMYPYRVFAAEGGLMSYGSDPVDLWRRSAAYIDRILRGAKPSELPVQFPTKFELVINLKTAKAIGLTVPLSLRALATEVIE
jgi:putative ABC transport system substrate-binding protein